MFVIKDYETAQPYLLAKNSPPPLRLKLLCTEPAPAQSLSLRLMEPRGVSHKKPVVRSRLTVSELKSVRAVCAGLQHRDNVPLASAPGVTPLSSTQPPKSAHPSFFSLFFCLFISPYHLPPISVYSFYVFFPFKQVIEFYLFYTIVKIVSGTLSSSNEVLLLVCSYM